jgi:flagellar biogenesis protein FliO
MELIAYLQYVLALVFVLALIGLTAWLVKRFGAGGGIGGRRGSRVAVLDAAIVDKRRRLLLIRRDNVEHLVMIGGPQDVVIESGIRVEHAARQVEPEFTARSAEPVLREPAAPRPQPPRPQRQPAPEAPAAASPEVEAPAAGRPVRPAEPRPERDVRAERPIRAEREAAPEPDIRA